MLTLKQDPMKSVIKKALVFFILSLTFPLSASAYFSAGAHINSVSFRVGLTAEEPSYSTHLWLDNQWAIHEEIQNGNFSEGLGHWQTEGSVEVSYTETGSQVTLGGQGQLLGESVLEQEITFAPAFIAYELQLQSNERLVGFDEPCFVVMVNHSVLNQDFCDPERLVTAWNWRLIDLRAWYGQAVKLQFLAGNTGDRQGDVLAEVRNITSLVAAITRANRLMLQHEKSSISHWRINTPNAVFDGQTEADGYLLPPELSGWAKLEASPDSDSTFRPMGMIYFDYDPPKAIRDLEAMINDNGTVSLSWSSPESNLQYLMHIETGSQDEVDVHLRNAGDFLISFDGLPGRGWRSSKPDGQEEVYDLDLALNQWPLPLSISISSRDAAGNTSSISNVVEVK